MVHIKEPKRYADVSSSTAALDAMVVGQRRLVTYRELSSALGLSASTAKNLLLNYASQHARELICVWTVTIRVGEDCTRVALFRGPYPGPLNCDGNPVATKCIWGVAPSTAAPPRDAHDLWTASDRVREMELVGRPPKDVNELRDNRWSMYKSETAGWIRSPSKIPKKEEFVEHHQTCDDKISVKQGNKSFSLLDQAKKYRNAESRERSKVHDTKIIAQSEIKLKSNAANGIADFNRPSRAKVGKLSRLGGVSAPESNPSKAMKQSGERRRRKIYDSDEEENGPSVRSNRRLEGGVHDTNDSAGEPDYLPRPREINGSAHPKQEALNDEQKPTRHEGHCEIQSYANSNVPKDDKQKTNKWNDQHFASTHEQSEGAGRLSKKSRNLSCTPKPDQGEMKEGQVDGCLAFSNSPDRQSEFRAHASDSQHRCLTGENGSSSCIKRVVEESVVDDKGYIVTRRVTRWFMEDGTEIPAKDSPSVAPEEPTERLQSSLDECRSGKVKIASAVPVARKRKFSKAGDPSTSDEHVKPLTSGNATPSAVKGTARKSKGNIASYFGK